MAETDGGLNETQDLCCITITRIEEQRRGAIHVHRLIWFPDLEPITLTPSSGGKGANATAGRESNDK